MNIQINVFRYTFAEINRLPVSNPKKPYCKVFLTACKSEKHQRKPRNADVRPEHAHVRQNNPNVRLFSPNVSPGEAHVRPENPNVREINPIVSRRNYITSQKNPIASEINGAASVPTAPQATAEYRPKPTSHKIYFPLKHYHYGNIRRRDPRAVPAIAHQRRITAGHCGNYG